MKKKITVLALIVFVASASTAFSRAKHHGKHGGYKHGNHNRSYYHGYRGGHHNDGLEFAVGVAGGLLLGSALTYSATTPPPQTIVYGTPYTTTYQPQVVVQQPVVQQPVVQQPTICVEDRIVNGQWQINQNDGSKIWRSSRYPIIQRVQVPCY